MATRVTIKNAPFEVNLQECTIGSVLRWRLKIEEETTPGSGVWTPFDVTTGYDLEAQLKKNVKSEEDPLAVIEVEAETGPDLGYFNFEIDGPVTLDIGMNVGAGDYHWSFKVTPTGDIEDGTTIVQGTIPFVWRAVR